MKNDRDYFDKRLLQHIRQTENDEVRAILEDKNVCELADYLGATLEYWYRTALHTAVQLMDLDNAAMLVKYKADVNAKDANGRIPLYYYNFTFHCQNQPTRNRENFDE